MLPTFSFDILLSKKESPEIIEIDQSKENQEEFENLNIQDKIVSNEISVEEMEENVRFYLINF